MSDMPAPVAAYYDALNAHDAAAAARLYRTDGTHEEANTGGTRAGHGALEKGLAGFFGFMPDVQWTPEKTIRAGDHVVVSYRMTGTARGRAIVLDGVHLFDLDGTEILATRDFWDMAAFRAQLA